MELNDVLIGRDVEQGAPIHSLAASSIPPVVMT